MARAKNTSRAEARKRTRDEARAELAAQQEPEDGGQATPDTGDGKKAGYQPRRSGVLFKWPNIRGDFASIVPQFRAKPLLWLPFGLIAVGFVVYVTYFGLPPEIQQFAVLYLQFFFTPAALFTYFIAGFLATRASYLFGGLAGLAIGVLTVVAYLLLGAVTVDPTTAPQLSGTDLLLGSIALIAQTTLIGGAAGGFAGWYRDFLRRMQTNSRAKQAQREQEAKAKRAAERQESRKAAKSRSTS